MRAAGDDEVVRSDAELIADVRGRPADDASTAAFATLWERHQDAARALARQLARSPADADDLVSATFARMLEVLRAGHGPTEAFRAYLLTTLRHLAYDRTRAERRVEVTDTIGDVVGVDPERTVVPFTDTAVAGLERSLAAQAFATLPERWQAVLWHLEVEGDSPADIAPLFGLTPNAVSALGYRAREGLRQAYLQQHLSSSPGLDRRHRETGERLGAWTRGGLSRREAARVEAHLAECEECRALAAELREVNSRMMRATVAPLVLGAAVVGYLATRGSGSGGLLALPGTGEMMVAGGGVLGVLGALGGALRAGPLPRPAAVGLGVVGAGAAAVALLVPSSAPAPPGAAPPRAALPPAALPSTGLPSTGLPSTGLPSPGRPATGLPSTGLPPAAESPRSGPPGTTSSAAAGSRRPGSPGGTTTATTTVAAGDGGRSVQRFGPGRTAYSTVAAGDGSASAERSLPPAEQEPTAATADTASQHADTGDAGQTAGAGSTEASRTGRTGRTGRTDRTDQADQAERAYRAARAAADRSTDDPGADTVPFLAPGDRCSATVPLVIVRAGAVCGPADRPAVLDVVLR